MNASVAIKRQPFDKFYLVLFLLSWTSQHLADTDDFTERDVKPSNQIFDELGTRQGSFWSHYTMARNETRSRATVTFEQSEKEGARHARMRAPNICQRHHAFPGHTHTQSNTHTTSPVPSARRSTARGSLCGCRFGCV